MGKCLDFHDIPLLGRGGNIRKFKVNLDTLGIMGIKSLWSLLNGQIIDPGSLCNHRLAMCISIWSLKFQSEERMFRDILEKLGKLLYFGIKPIVVFDNPVTTFPIGSKRGMKGSTSENDARIMAKRILERRIINELAKKEKGKNQKEKIYLEQIKSSSINAILNPSNDLEFSKNQIATLINKRHAAEKLEKLKSSGNKIASNEKKRFILIKEEGRFINSNDKTCKSDENEPLECKNDDLDIKLARNGIKRMSNEFKNELLYLIELLGIPWMEASYKADAQCVWLLDNKFIDGIITDDNDIFLFGAKDYIYRDFFRKNKHLMKYSIDESYTREELITLSALLSKKHGQGIVSKGIGIKKAMKLRKLLKEMDESFDLTTIRTLSVNGCKDIQVEKMIQSIELDHDYCENNDNHIVMEDYMNPIVENVSINFEWNRIKIEGLCILLAEKLGWTNQKTIEFINNIKKSKYL